MEKIRSVLMIAAMLLITACLMAPTALAKYPDRPITLAVGFSAGGSTDQVARVLAAAAEKVLGQSIVVINKPGGGGTIAASWLKGQKPNGYKLVVMTPAVVAGGITKKVPYNVFTDFTPILRFTGFTHCIGSLETKPWKSLKEMLDYAKKSGQPLLQGSPGVGTMPHLAAAELASKAGVKFKHVPFKGGKPQLASMLGGHIDFYNGPPVFWPHVKTGKVNFLAVYSDKRLAAYPDVPTVIEVGYDVVAPSPIGIAGPKGLKPDVVKVLHDAFKKAAEDPAVVKVCSKLLMTLTYENAEQYKKTMKEMWDYYAAIADRLGLRVKK